MSRFRQHAERSAVGLQTNSNELMGTSGLLTRQNAQEVSHTLGPTSTQEYVLRKFDSQRGFPDKLATTADFVTLQNARCKVAPVQLPSLTSFVSDTTPMKHFGRLPTRSAAFLMNSRRCSTSLTFRTRSN